MRPLLFVCLVAVIGGVAAAGTHRRAENQQGVIQQVGVDCGAAQCQAKVTSVWANAVGCESHVSVRKDRCVEQFNCAKTEGGFPTANYVCNRKPGNKAGCVHCWPGGPRDADQRKNTTPKKPVKVLTKDMLNQDFAKALSEFHIEGPKSRPPLDKVADAVQVGSNTPQEANLCWDWPKYERALEMYILNMRTCEGDTKYVNYVPFEDDYCSMIYVTDWENHPYWATFQQSGCSCHVASNPDDATGIWVMHCNANDLSKQFFGICRVGLEGRKGVSKKDCDANPEWEWEPAYCELPDGTIDWSALSPPKCDEVQGKLSASNYKTEDQLQELLRQSQILQKQRAEKAVAYLNEHKKPANGEGQWSLTHSLMRDDYYADKKGNPFDSYMSWGHYDAATKTWKHQMYRQRVRGDKKIESIPFKTAGAQQQQQQETQRGKLQTIKAGVGQVGHVIQKGAKHVQHGVQNAGKHIKDALKRN